MDPAPWAQTIVARSELPYVTAFAAGLLAAIGPCPIATNITALGYISQQFADRRAVVASGILYALGRALAYGLVGFLVLVAGARISRVAGGLQNVADLVLAPFLLVSGLVLLNVIRPRLPSGGDRLGRLRSRVATSKRGGAFGLGFLFALAFCPYSATLFFLVLIPLAASTSGGVGMPLVFGLGTALPVLVLGIPLALGLERAATGFDRVNRIEAVVRTVVGWIFVAAGLYSLVRLLDGVMGRV